MNATNTSITSSTWDKKHVISYHLIVISGLILVYSLMSLSVFIRAPRIATNIRFLCGNIVFYNICWLLTFALYNMKIDFPRKHFFRISLQGVNLQLVATTVFSVERLIAINYPYNYRKFVKISYVRVFILLQLILYALIICLILGTERRREGTTSICWIRTSVHIILTTVCLCCSMKALVIFRKTYLTVQAASNNFQHTIKQGYKWKAIMSVCCLLSVLLHVPIAAEIMIQGCKEMGSQQFYTIYVLLFNTAIDPLIYMWKFRECRLHGLMYLSRLPFLKFLQAGVERQRIAIFNIPVSERRAHAVDQPATRL